jgi:hypothetical protein
MVDSMESPQGDHVDRTAAARAVTAATTRMMSVMGLLGGRDRGNARVRVGPG